MKVKKLMTSLTALVVAVAFMPAIAFAGTADQAAPAAPQNLKGVVDTKTSVKLSWSKVDNASGYEVFKKDGEKFKKVGTTSKVTFVNKKLKSDKTHVYKVRSFKKIEGQKKYSKYTYTVSVKTTTQKESDKVRNVNTVKLNKTAVKATVGDKVTLKASLIPNKKLVSSNVVWTTSNIKVAGVSNGVVTAKGEGTCYIYARAHNGLKAKCKVTVTDIERESTMAQDVEKMAAAVDTKFSYDLTRDLAYNMDLADEDNGWRTAGSDAEHRTADYLVDVFKEIGLTGVEKVDVDVDKWQFNEAYLNFKNDGGKTTSVIVDPIISYASSYKGTITEDIVYLGHGYEADYEAYYDKMGLEGEDRNMNGKIVLADINQNLEYWITPHYIEAYNQGAGGIITYSSQYVNEDGTQTGTKWDDAVQVQDICSRNFEIPCLSISRADGLKLKKAIETIEKSGGQQDVELYVDNEIGEDAGISYNVIGKIEGTGNTDQQILVAGHYDKYWYGFQDDCVAIGVVAGVAKALVDSGYKPVNDIIFVAHAAEEWARCGAEADWAIGSWEMITEAHPEWSGKTLALFNYELSAGKGEEDNLYVDVNSVEEIGNTTDVFNNSELLPLLGDKIKKENVSVDHYTQPSSDAISYQLNGVPCIQVNTSYGHSEDLFSIYHTQYDDKTTYNADALKYNIAYSAGYLIQTDKLPAQEFDLTLRCDELEAGISEDASLYKEAGVDIDAYKAALADLREAANAYSEKIKDINDRYYAAVENGASKAEIDKIRAEGVEQNKKSLEMYQYLQDEFIAFASSGDVQLYHVAVQTNLELMKKVVDGLKNPDNIGQAFSNAWKLNGAVDYVAYNFSKATCKEAVDTISGRFETDTWTYGRQPGIVNVNMATYAFMTGTNSEGFVDEIKIYEDEIERLNGVLKQYVESETNAMNNLTKELLK